MKEAHKRNKNPLVTMFYNRYTLKLRFCYCDDSTNLRRSTRCNYNVLCQSREQAIRNTTEKRAVVISPQRQSKL